MHLNLLVCLFLLFQVIMCPSPLLPQISLACFSICIQITSPKLWGFCFLKKNIYIWSLSSVAILILMCGAI